MKLYHRHHHPIYFIDFSFCVETRLSVRFTEPIFILLAPCTHNTIHKTVYSSRASSNQHIHASQLSSRSVGRWCRVVGGRFSLFLFIIIIITLYHVILLLCYRCLPNAHGPSALSFSFDAILNTQQQQRLASVLLS